jgi:ERCC4-type nuclease
MNHAQPAAPPKGPVIIKRDGHNISRSIPLPTVIIDSNEQRPFDFSYHANWIGASVRRKLPTGDYSIEGMEDILTLERKSLADLILTLTQYRSRFFAECERMVQFKHRAIIIEASYQDIKTPYPDEVFTLDQEVEAQAVGQLHTKAHPNGISGSLDAINAKYGIEILYTARRRDLAQERAASWLSKHYLYWYLETQGMGRTLQDGDL